MYTIAVIIFSPAAASASTKSVQFSWAASPGENEGRRTESGPAGENPFTGRSVTFTPVRFPIGVSVAFAAARMSRIAEKDVLGETMPGTGRRIRRRSGKDAGAIGVVVVVSVSFAGAVGLSGAGGWRKGAVELSSGGAPHDVWLSVLFSFAGAHRNDELKSEGTVAGLASEKRVELGENAPAGDGASERRAAWKRGKVIRLAKAKIWKISTNKVLNWDLCLALPSPNPT